MKRTTATLATALLAGSLTGILTLPAVAQTPPIGVVVNGSLVPLDQPPVEQAGRVFFPLRGIFERLGASVVFQNGRINATAGPTTIALQIGQPTALIDGQTRGLSDPPFLVAGRALVPLRFIAEALGARVTFESTGPYGRAVVVDAGPNGAVAPAVGSAPVRPRSVPPIPVLHHDLIREEPANGSTIAAIRPEISATFAMPTDPDSVKVSIDGRDVTSDAYINDRNVVVHPLFDLTEGDHRVRVTGTAAQPQQSLFDESWVFTVATPRGENFLRDVEPENGAHVGSAFDVRGFTEPGAHVHLIAAASARAFGFDETNQDQTAADTNANEDGYFRIHVDLADQGSGVVDVRLVSTTPNGSVTVQTLRLRP